MFRFLFVVALVFTQKILSYIKGVSVKLQGRYVDIARAHTEIENVKSTLNKLRSDVERFHTQTYNEVLVLCQSVGIEESTPQTHREKWCAISSTFTCAISMCPVLAQFTCAILFSVLYLAHARCAILSVLSNPIAPIKILSNH